MLDLNTMKDMIRKSPATTFLVVLLIGTFLASYIYGEGPTEFKTARLFGAIQTQDATTDDLFRLISYTFLQIGGPIHLLMNLSMIVVAGPFLERVYGAFKYTILFLVAGMFGGLFVLMFSASNIIVGGASGSGYGLIGLYVGLVLRKHPFIDDSLKNWVWNLLWINIVYTAFVPGISIAGHIGGLVGGLLLSMIVRYQTNGQFYRSTWISSLFKSVLGFITVLIMVYIPKMIWPSTVIPFVQEVRIKFGETSALDTYSGQVVGDSLGKEFFLDRSVEGTNAMNYYLKLLLEIIKTSFIEIIVCIIFVVLIYKLLKQMRLGRIVRKIIKTNYLYNLAKEKRQDHIIYRISESTLNSYENKYPKFNRQNLKKKIQFEMKMMFGKPLMQVLHLFIGTVKVSAILVMLGFLSIFISMINDNKELNMASFEERLYIDAVANYNNGNYKEALNLIEMISSQSILYAEAQKLIPSYHQAYDNQVQTSDSDSELALESETEVFDDEDIDTWVADVENGRLEEMPEFYIGQIFGTEMFDELVRENYGQFVSIGGYYAGEIMPGQSSHVRVHLYPLDNGYYTIGQMYYNGGVVDEVEGINGVLDIITTSLSPY